MIKMLDERDELKVVQAFATRAHEGQLRKDNKTPYIAHPEAVVNTLKGIGIEDKATLAAAWLHDTIEDCGVTVEQLANAFRKDIVGYVILLTRPRNEDKMFYAQRIYYSAPKNVQLVKLADTLHNLQTLELIAEPESKNKAKTNLLKAYETYYRDLANEISPELYSRLEEVVKGINEVKI